jgi:predicted permease
MVVSAAVPSLLFSACRVPRDKHVAIIPKRTFFVFILFIALLFYLLFFFVSFIGAKLRRFPKVYNPIDEVDFVP